MQQVHDDAELVTVGETLALMSNAQPGLLRHQRRLDLGIGGSESNVAIGARRLGTSSAWIGRVGDDEFGHLVMRELLAETVRVHATTDPERPTALMVKERRTSDTARVFYYRSGSAGANLAVTDLDRDLIERAKVLHVTGITLALSDSAREAVDVAVGWAREAGTAVSLDLNYRSRLWNPDQFAATLQPLLSRADLVFGSEHEFEYLVGAGTPLAQLEKVASARPGEVVVKRGASGASARSDGRLVESAALAVPAIDTVGAGDAFVAGWLSEWIRHEPVEQRMRTAIACGAFACTVAGDWEGAPTRPELEQWQAAGDSVHR